MFSGVNFFPKVLPKSLEVQNGEGGGTFRCCAKDMNDFLGHGSMFPLRACLDFFVQAIRQIFDIQRSHRFLQNATSMEESGITVKYGEIVLFGFILGALLSAPCDPVEAQRYSQFVSDFELRISDFAGTSWDCTETYLAI
jgi:hypothetical protein